MTTERVVPLSECTVKVGFPDIVLLYYSLTRLERDSDDIKEFQYDDGGKWSRGSDLPVALRGSL